MRHGVWKSIVGIATVCALSLSGTTSALANDTKQNLSTEKITETFDTIMTDSDVALEEFDYADSTARTFVKKEIGVSTKSLDFLVSDKVTLSLNVNDSSPSVSGEILSEKLTAKDKIFIAAAWPFIVDNFWDLIGIGSCYSLVRGR